MALGTPVAAATAYSASGGTTVAPAYPANIAATDVVLLFVGQKPTTNGGGTVTTPTGWTLQEERIGGGGYAAAGSPVAADQGDTNIRIYSWNSPVANQSGTLSVTLGGNDVSFAFIVRIPTGGGTISYGASDGQDTTGGNVSVTLAANPGLQTGDLAIWAMSIPTDVTTPTQFSAHVISATGAVFATATELNEPDSNAGNDIGGFTAYASVTSGTASAAPTITATAGGTTTNVRGPLALLRIREAALQRTLTADTQTYNETLRDANLSRSRYVYGNTCQLTVSDQLKYRDTFDYSNGVLSTVSSGVWVDRNGSIDILNGRFYESLGSNSYAELNTSTYDFHDNQEAEILVSLLGSGDYPGPAVRVTASGAYIIHADGTNDPSRSIYRLDGTTRVKIGTLTIAPINGDTLKIRAVGNQISAYKNGILIETVTDNTYSTGQPGIYYNRGNINASRGDNFVGYTVGVDSVNLKVGRRVFGNLGLFRLSDQLKYRDTFNYSNGELATVSSGNWTNLLNDIDIFNGEFYETDGSTRSYAAVSTSVYDFLDNHESEILITALNVGDRIGPGVRLTSSGGYALSIDGFNDGGRAILRIDGTNGTIIGTVPIVPVVGDTLTLRVVGNQISAYINNVLIDTVTDNTYSTGQPGIYYNRTNVNTSRGDNFVAYSIVEDSIGIKYNRKLTADVRAYTFTGNDATLTKTSSQKTLTAEKGTFTVAGQNLFFFRGLNIPITAQAFTLTGPPTTIIGILASKQITIEAPAGYALHVVTDISQAALSTCIYNGQSPAIQVGDQILYRTTTVTNSYPVSINSTGIVSAAGPDTFKYYIWSAGTWSAELTYTTITQSRTLVADSRSFALNLQPANILRNRRLVATTQTYNENLQPANLLRNRRLVADTRAYTETLQPANILRNRRLVADTQTYNENLQPANLLRNRRLVADTRAYTETLQPANILRNRRLVADTQTYNEDLKAANILRNRRLVADTQTYNENLQPANILRNRRLVADTQTYNENLQPANILRNRRLVADTQTYNENLQPANLLRNRRLVADTQTYNENLQPANILRNRRLVADTRALILTRNDATFKYSRVVIATTQTYTLSGKVLSFVSANVLKTDTRSYTLTRNDATLIVSRRLTSDSQTYNENLQPANLLRGRRIVADVQTYNENLQPANLFVARKLLAAVQTYNENLQPANILRNRKLIAESQTYNENLQSANILRNRRLVADVQTYNDDLKAANILRNRRLVADTQTYNENLQPANVLRNSRLVADTQTYNENLQPANINTGKRLVAESGTFAENLQPANLRVSRRLVADTQTYNENLQPANVLRNRRLVADTQTYNENLQPANLRVARFLSATTQNYSLIGNALNFASAGNIIANSRAYTITINDTVLRVDRKLSLDSQTYNENLQPANLLRNRRLIAETGTFSENLQSANLLRNRRLITDTQTYNENLQPANLSANKRLVADTGAYTLTRNDASLIGGEKLPLDTAQYNLTGGTLAFRRTYVLTATTKAIELSGYVEGGYVEPGYVSTSIQILYGRKLSLSTVTYTLTGQLTNITTARGLIKVWTGSAWVLKPLKVWNGTAWVTKPIKIWNGTTWRTY